MHCQKGLEMLYKKGFICFAKKISYASQKMVYKCIAKPHLSLLSTLLLLLIKLLNICPHLPSLALPSLAHEIWQEVEPSHYINRLHPAITNSSATSNKAIMRSTHCVILFYVTVVLQYYYLKDDVMCFKAFI